jgi:IS1 family transposase
MVFFDVRAPEEKVMLALKMILVRVSLSDISFVLGVKEQTVLAWLERATHKAKEINTALLNALPVTEVQLDEMWSFVKRKVSDLAEGEVESPQKADDGRQWVWLGYAPEFRLILATVVGPRTSETALKLIQRTARIVSGIPAFFSDGFSTYLQTLIEGTGGGHHLSDSVGCRTLWELRLTISTTLLERLNLTFRQARAPLVRKTLSFSKEHSHLEQHTQFFHVFYNFARPHMSLREQLRDTAPRFEQKWRPRTPAMAAGITDHVWTFKELLTVNFAHVP